MMMMMTINIDSSSRQRHKRPNYCIANTAATNVYKQHWKYQVHITHNNILH